MSEIRVLIADDHRIVRQGLRHVCEMVGGFTVVGEAEDGRTALRLARQLRPDVILMDIHMPGLDGVQATSLKSCIIQTLKTKLPGFRHTNGAGWYPGVLQNAIKVCTVHEKLKVLILDEDEAFRQRLCLELANASDILVIANGDTSDLTLLDARQPDLILFGLGSHPSRDLQALVRIVRVPGVKIIVLHRAGEEPLVLEALRLGISAHLCKDDLAQGEVAAAIRTVARGEAVLSPRLTGHVLDEVQQKRPGGKRTRTAS